MIIYFEYLRFILTTKNKYVSNFVITCYFFTVRTVPYGTLLMSLVERFTFSSRFLIGWMLLLKSDEQSSSNRALRKTKQRLVRLVTTRYWKCYWNGTRYTATNMVLDNTHTNTHLQWSHLETLHSKSMPSYKESTKQLAEPSEDSECLAMSAPFISFIMARALPLTSCLKVLKRNTHTLC